MNNVDDFKRFISEFNEIINENVNNAEVKRLLKARSITFDEKSKGNKLLQRVYESVLGDTENLIAPFFYLYDLRLWADHAMSDEKLEAVARSLAVASPRNYQELMEALIGRLHASAAALLAKVNGRGDR